MFALLLAAACFSPLSRYGAIAIGPLSAPLFDAARQFSRASYAYDAAYEYIGTSTGLYRTRSLAGGSVELLFHGQVNAVAVHDGALYAALEGVDSPGSRALSHTLIRSTDGGATFVPLDAALEECAGGYCRFLSATQIDFAPGRVFLAAGGGLLVSSDDAKTWKVLSGATGQTKPATLSCPMVFGRNGQRVVIGGECPLDFGYVSTGVLRSDLLEWETAPRRLTDPNAMPPLENRNVQFVAYADGETYAGIEGGLLKSCDAERTWRFVIHDPISGGARAYPYIQQFIAPARLPNVRIVAGFDKATAGPYLAWSGDSGETWIDASGLLPAGSSVALLAEGRDGRPLIFIQQGTTIGVAQLAVSPLSPRRRAVGH